MHRPRCGLTSRSPPEQHTIKCARKRSCGVLAMSQFGMAFFMACIMCMLGTSSATTPPTTSTASPITPLPTSLPTVPPTTSAPSPAPTPPPTKSPTQRPTRVPTVVQCTVSTLSNAKALTDTLSKDLTTSYTCEEGYRDSNAKKHQGNFASTKCVSSVIPVVPVSSTTCEQITCLVQPLSNSVNADAEKSIIYSETTTWKCNNGYTNSNGFHRGTYSKQCGDGTPTLEAASVCNQIICKAAGVANSDSTSDTSLTLGQTKTYKCDANYKPNNIGGFGRGGSSFTSGSCNTAGNDVTLNTCIPATCDPDPFDNAVPQQTDPEAGDQATFTCKENFGVAGAFATRTFQSTCKNNNQYNTGDRCQPLSCDNQQLNDDDQNSEQKNGITLAGSNTLVTCKSNYGKNGGRTGISANKGYARLCVDKGTSTKPVFDSTTDICRIVVCTDPPNDGNAVLSANQANAGNSLTYTCKENFGATQSAGQVGTSTYARKCNANSQAFENPVTSSGTNKDIRCKQITCVLTNSDALYPSNGSPASATVDAGTRMTINCDTNYGSKLSNSNYGDPTDSNYQYQCNANRQLSSLAGSAKDTCRIIVCDNFPVVANSDHPTTVVDSGNGVLYTCDQNYGIDGNPYSSTRASFRVTCLQSGLFASNSKTCVQVSCPAPQGDNDGWRKSTGSSLSNPKAGHTFTSTCYEGSIMNIGGKYVDTSSCLTTGEFSKSLADCVVCPIGYKCAREQPRTECSAFTEYNDDTNRTSCKSVSTGYYSFPRSPTGPNTQQVACEKGYKCIGGVKIACGDNEYQNTPGQSSCKTVDTGYYITTTVAATSQFECEEGYKCVAGVRIACETDTFQNVKGKTACETLTGYNYVVKFDDAETLRIGQELCEAGSYCSLTRVALNDRLKSVCGFGYRCPGDGIRYRCDDAVTYSDIIDADDCTPCSECPKGENVVAVCKTTQDTQCFDKVEPVIEIPEKEIFLEAAVDSFDFGDVSETVSAFDLGVSKNVDFTSSVMRSSAAGGFIVVPNTDNVRNCGIENLQAPCTKVSVDGCGYNKADMTKTGTFTVEYAVKDLQCNLGVNSRTVNVRDTRKPIIHINQVSPIEIEISSSTTLLAQLKSTYAGLVGVTDELDDALLVDHNNSVKVRGLDDLFKAAGAVLPTSLEDTTKAHINQQTSTTAIEHDYTKLDAALRLRSQGWDLQFYGIKDTKGDNLAVPVNLTFVIKDVTPPSLVPNKPSLYVEASSSPLPFSTFDAGTISIDYVWGNLSHKVAVKSEGGFAQDKVADYVITYTVTDGSGNTQEETSLVSVDDQTPPELTFAQTNDIVFNYNTTWTKEHEDFVFSVSDNLDDADALWIKTTTQATLVISGTASYTFDSSIKADFDTMAPLGTQFNLTYSVVDDHDNVAMSQTRLVRIVDELPPTMSFQNTTNAIVSLVSGDVYIDACPVVVDNHDAFANDCEDVNDDWQASDWTSNPAVVAGKVHRKGYKARNLTSFSNATNFNITYIVIDSSGNVNALVRQVQVAQKSTSVVGMSPGGTAGIVIFMLILIAVAVAGFVYYQRRENSTMANKSGPPVFEFSSPGFVTASEPPPPLEMWFHGDIERSEAEDRLRASGALDGMYLVRTRATNGNSFALSLVVNQKIIHYALSIPSDGSSPLLIQGVPTPPDWGSCLHDIMSTLKQHHPDCTIPTDLQTPAPVPGPPREVVDLYDREINGTNAAPSSVYAELTSSSKRYKLGEPFILTADGVFYQIFVPKDRVHASIPLFTRQRSPTALGDDTFTLIKRSKIQPWTPIYVRVEPEHLAPSLSIELPEEEVFASYSQPHSATTDIDSEIVYANVNTADDDQTVIYSLVANTNNRGESMSGFGDDAAITSDVMYSAMEFDGFSVPVYNPQAPVADTFTDDDSGLIYTSISHKDGPADDDLVYTAIEHGNSPSDAVYAAPEKQKTKHLADQQLIYTATQEAPPTADPRSITQDVYSAVQKKPEGKKHKYVNIMQDGSKNNADDGSNVLALPPKQTKTPANRYVKNPTNPQPNRMSLKLEQKPEEPSWIHHVERSEAEKRLNNAGGFDGHYLVRPKGVGYAMSIVLRGRFVHRLIEEQPDGSYLVDRQAGNWGNTLAKVVETLASEMQKKHNLSSTTAVPKPSEDKAFEDQDDFDGFA
eukprot:m.116912 g.116912  ORF g.116912 m.116912 type:complete len:2149 (-) comp28545_c0_seq1:240-6686(-)